MVYKFGPDTPWWNGIKRICAPSEANDVLLPIVGRGPGKVLDCVVGRTPEHDPEKCEWLGKFVCNIANELIPELASTGPSICQQYSMELFTLGSQRG